MHELDQGIHLLKRIERCSGEVRIYFTILFLGKRRTHLAIGHGGIYRPCIGARIRESRNTSDFLDGETARVFHLGLHWHLSGPQEPRD